MNKRKKRIKINVTQRDIDAAIEDIKFGKMICQVCPVARAVRRHKNFDQATIGKIYVNLRDKELLVELPEKVRLWINIFDAKQEVKPFQFTIEVPECLIQQ